MSVCVVGVLWKTGTPRLVRGIWMMEQAETVKSRLQKNAAFVF